MKYWFQCNDCGKVFRENFLYLCPDCSAGNSPSLPPTGVLKTLYDYDLIRGAAHPANLFDELYLQKFLPLLPVQHIESFGPLRVGNTPLVEVAGLVDNRRLRVLVKDDSQNPTFSFKDRASVLVSAWAAENNITTLVAASTGNAGSSLAGICASNAQNSVILAPASAPPAKLLQMMMYGARTVLVDGTYDDAFDLSITLTERLGWFNRNTAFNPFTIEGKKTVAFEIFRQTCGAVPDFIFVPVGDGVILSGLYKGLEDLLMLGILRSMPVVVAVQSKQSDNLVRNHGQPTFVSRQSTTLADSISVDIPRNFHMASAFLTRYNGATISVDDQDIVFAARRLAACSGVFTEPAGAAAVAGFLKWSENQKGTAAANVVILATGSGLKDVATPLINFPFPQPVQPHPDAVIEFLKRN